MPAASWTKTRTVSAQVTAAASRARRDRRARGIGRIERVSSRERVDADRRLGWRAILQNGDPAGAPALRFLCCPHCCEGAFSMHTALILVIDDDEDVRVTLGQDLLDAG